MTAKNFDETDLKYGKSVLAKLGLTPPDDHLGILYDAYIVAQSRYDPLKSNWLTFFGYTLRSEVQNERRYGKVIHIPVMEQADDTNKFEYLPLDHSIDDTPLHDIIADERDVGAESHLLAHFSDSLASIYNYASNGQKQAVKAMQHHIFDDEPLPRKLRTELVWVRAEMYKKYKEWKKC